MFAGARERQLFGWRLCPGGHWTADNPDDEPPTSKRVLKFWWQKCSGPDRTMIKSSTQWIEFQIQEQSSKPYIWNNRHVVLGVFAPKSARWHLFWLNRLRPWRCCCATRPAAPCPRCACPALGRPWCSTGWRHWDVWSQACKAAAADEDEDEDYEDDDDDGDGDGEDEEDDDEYYDDEYHHSIGPSTPEIGAPHGFPPSRQKLRSPCGAMPPRVRFLRYFWRVGMGKHDKPTSYTPYDELISSSSMTSRFVE